VGEALGLELQGLDLAVLGCGALDFLDYVPQVIRLAVYVLASGRELPFAPLVVSQPLVRVAHRRPLDRRVGVRIEHVTLGIGPEQGLGLVLAVQVDEDRAELRQDTDGCGAAVGPGTGAPFPADFPLQDESPVLGLHPQGGKGR